MCHVIAIDTGDMPSIEFSEGIGTRNCLACQIRFINGGAFRLCCHEGSHRPPDMSVHTLICCRRWEKSNREILCYCEDGVFTDKVISSQLKRLPNRSAVHNDTTRYKLSTPVRLILTYQTDLQGHRSRVYFRPRVARLFPHHKCLPKLR